LAALQRHIVGAVHERRLAMAATAHAPHLNLLGRQEYSDAYLKSVLSSVRVIAMVGASMTPGKPSYVTMEYMQSKGFRVIPVNPAAQNQTVLGEKIYADMADIPSSLTIDM
ncbi:unnamed protein product, partial [Polarella glacialis]